MKIIFALFLGLFLSHSLLAQLYTGEQLDEMDEETKMKIWQAEFDRVNPASKKQLQSLKIYPKESELNQGPSEALRILRSQFKHNFPFLLEAIYVGNNKSYVPAVIVTTQAQANDQELSEIQGHLNELLKAFQYQYRWKLNTFVYRKNKLYSIVSSKKTNEEVKIYPFAPIQKDIDSQLEELSKLASSESSKIKNQDILEIYWKAMPHLADLNLPYTLLIISKDSENGLHMSQMIQEFRKWKIDYFGPVQKMNYGYLRLHSIGNKGIVDNIPMRKKQYVLTEKKALLEVDNQYFKLADKKYLKPLYLRVK